LNSKNSIRIPDSISREKVSAKAQERARLHDEGYALITAQNAAAAAERGMQRGSG
jgi:hypothetical protein